MKTSKAILIGSILSILVLWIFAYSIEHGDTNAISMYFVVFLVPLLICAFLNGLILELAKKPSNKVIKRIISIVPMVFCMSIYLMNEQQIPFVDGRQSFIGLVLLISIGLTNFVWNMRLRTNK